MTITVYVPGTEEKDLAKVILSLQQIASAIANRVSLSVNASAVTSIAGTATTVTFGTTSYDSHGAWSSPTWTTPVAFRYRISSTISIAGLTIGNTVTLSIFINGVSTRTAILYAGGLANESFYIAVDLELAKGDLVTIRAHQNSGGNLNTTNGTATRLSISQIS